MELTELKANIRTSVGNGPARALRREKQIPAVLYGPKTEPTLLSVNISDLEQTIKKKPINQVLLNLIIQKNGKTDNRTAMIKELQTNPVARNFLHVDFYEIAMDRKIKVKVPVIAKGKSKGVELGGFLQIVRRELDVFCLPHEIPESIEIDITDLDIGNSIHVKDISLKGDIEIPADVNFTVLTMLSPKAEEVEGEEVEGEEGEGEEVEGEEKASAADAEK